MASDSIYSRIMGWWPAPYCFSPRSVAGLLCVANRSRGLGLCGFILVYALYYMFAMTYVYGWYSVPLAAATILASALGADLLMRSVVSPALFGRITYSVAIGYLGLLALYIPVTFRGERQVQEFVENGNRKPIGEYLAAVDGSGPDRRQRVSWVYRLLLAPD